MKRWLSILCALGLAFGATAAFASQPGDCNGDGVVNETDVELARDAMNSAEGDERYIPAADIDGDGYISARDLHDVLSLSTE